MKYPTKLLKKISEAPLQPGCYIYKDVLESVIYVGKAVSIRNRVKQYFQKIEMLDAKTRQLVMHIYDVEFVPTDSELDALILETNLIKKYKPRFNILMKDDKSYAYIEITNEEFPRIQVVRKKRKGPTYFGPYPSPMPVKRALRRLRKIFPYRSCNRTMYEEEQDGSMVITSSDPKPCLYYHLKLCDAPCANLTTKHTYRTNINSIKRFFRGERREIMNELQEKMKLFSEQKEFEKAAVVRNRLQDLHYIASEIRIEKDMDENEWKAKQLSTRLKALKALIEKLQFEGLELHEKFKIECYDVSNIQGTNATASMVVFVNASPQKNLYRKFKIKTKETPDDFAMMREIFDRRFKHMKRYDDESFSVAPDIIVVDGGKGQLSAAYRILRELNVEIPIIGLAKREEEVFRLVEESGELEFKKLKVHKKSQASYILQQIRDEAHRFALKYHRKLRAGKMVLSSLDDIPGIGEVTKKKLLQAFGSIEKIRNAPEADLLTITRNKKVVENIKKLL